MKFNPDSVIKSTRRLAEASRELKEKPNDPVLFNFIKKESGILLKRSIKLWFQLRFGR